MARERIGRELFPPDRGVLLMVARAEASYILGARTRNQPEEDAMTTMRTGEAAKAGFYFNLRSWELDLHRKDGAR